MKESEDFKELEKNHKKMLENYFNQNWDSAINCLENGEKLMKGLMKEYYEIFKPRIYNFKKNSPGENWDGVYVATSK